MRTGSNETAFRTWNTRHIGASRPPPWFAVVVEHGYSFVGSRHRQRRDRAAVRVDAGPWADHLMGGTGDGVGHSDRLRRHDRLFSRLPGRVHYVSDVLAGWLLGAAWAGAVILVGSWWADARRTRTTSSA